jgi:hypothetical protein
MPPRLIFVASLLLLAGLSADQEIVDRSVGVVGGNHPLRRFGLVSKLKCVTPPSRPAVIRDSLGPDLRRVTVEGYDRTRYKTFEALHADLKWLLDASPEDGTLSVSRGPRWSEAVPASAKGRIEWSDGHTGQLEFHGGTTAYAHWSDRNQCELWARFQRPRQP